MTSGFPEDFDVGRLPEYVSFDIFDTLIVRPFLRPTDLFRYMESIGAVPGGFAESRIRAEAEVRRRYRREVSLAEIYSVMPDEYQMPDKEIEAEKYACHADPESLGAFKKVLESGRKAIIISDMYLPQEVIAEILSNSGITGYSKLFVSVEMGATKYDGDLYPLVLSDLGISADQIAHIGDTKRPDIDMAFANGIRGIRYVRMADRYFAEHPYVKEFVSSKDLDRSVIVGMDMFRWSGIIGEKRDDVFELGFRFGGPMAVAYSDYIIGATEKDSRLLFVARDGYNLMRVLPILDPERKDLRYINAQRILSYVFTDSHIPYGPLDLPGKLLNRFVFQKIVSWAKYLLEFFEEDLGIDGIPEDPHELVALYNSRIDQIDSLRRAGAEDYRKYVLSFFGPEDVHLVDCTTMKFTSQKLIETMAGRKVHGHYFVSLAGSDMDYDSFHIRDRAVFGWSRINVPEFFMSSPELPVTGWKDGEALFMRDPPKWESDRCAMYGGITDGECCYAQQMKDIHRLGIPKMGYEAVTKWSMISADRMCPYRPVLDGIRWAAGPDHSDWSPLIPELKDIRFLAKRMATDFISKMNEM